MSYKWLEEEEHLLKLLRKTKTYQQIADEFSRRLSIGSKGFRTERSADAIRKKCDRDGISPESTQEYTEEKNEYTNFYKKVKEIQKEFRSRSVIRNRGLVKTSDIARKILILSDIHFPFSRIDFINQIMDEHSDADICVINGDMLDGYAASVYPKGKTVCAALEYICAFEFVHMLSQLFNKVYIVAGNHDIRTERYLKENGVPKELHKILGPNLLARIANGERIDQTGTLIEKLNFDNVFFDTRESWYVKIGKTIIAHPWNKGGKAPGYTVTKVNDFFHNRYHDSEYDSVVVGHTHKIYKGIINSKLLIEQGCLADVMDYAFSPKMQYGSDNGMNGYAIIYQDKDGNTDFNLSGPIFLGEVLPPKKDAAI